MSGIRNLVTPEHEASDPSSTRRTTRVRKQPQKYGDYLHTTPTKRSAPKYIESSDEEMEDIETCHQKPSALFGSGDVKGKEIYQFKSHSKLDMHKALSVVSSPHTNLPRTPKKTVVSQALRSPNKNEATPRHVKNIIKKRIIKEIEGDSESDFSPDSSSDFDPDHITSESESSSSSEDGSDSNDEEQEPTEKIQIVKNNARNRRKDPEYFVTPESYFSMHSSGNKISTSDHTLARLKDLNMDDSTQDIEISKEHQEKITQLNTTYRNLFDKWFYILSENFSLILYGIGSKRSILQQFQAEKLNNFPCIVVNGFFPSLTMKSVLETIIVDLLENANVPANLSDVVNLIDSQLSESRADLFVIVHNIDGPMLRSAKCQAVLASLASIKNVHMIATIDHINAPLLWDHSKLSKFKFTWWDVTTFMPYTEETSYENSLIGGSTAALQLSSLVSVYQSLTTTAKGIFNVLIRYQIENQKQSNYQGLPFKDLYFKCREQFLVSSDLALRAQLTEFFDHKLLKMKRTYDGSENLIILLDNTLLQQFIEQQS